MWEWARSGPRTLHFNPSSSLYRVFYTVGAVNDFAGRKGLLLQGRRRKNHGRRYPRRGLFNHGENADDAASTEPTPQNGGIGVLSSCLHLPLW